MSYPLLRISGTYAYVEVRKGSGAMRWREMQPIHRGPAEKGTEWPGNEGEKLSAKHCLWPSDPNSSLSLPYTVSSWAGLETGRAETLAFPTTVFGLAAMQAGDSDDSDSLAPPDLTLHEDPRSGNCYKIKLTAAMLGIPIATRQYDILNGETRTPEFLANVNTHGRIPVLQIGDQFLPESNAACFYLAEGSDLIPTDRFGRAQMLRWMFFEQYSHEPNIATLRFWSQFVGLDNLTEEQRRQMETKRAAGNEALSTMNEHLSEREWFAGDAASLADIVLFAYTHIANEGGFDLSDYPAVQRWLKRMPELPGFLAMA